MDQFAQIASNGIGGRDELLYQPEPQKIEKHSLKLNVLDKSFAVEPKMNNKQELLEELKKQRQYYSKFLSDNAPEIENYRTVINIKDFMLDGKKITIPDYSGPIGKGKKVYTTEFTLNDDITDKSVYICIDGADYNCFVYINGTCVGTHEGFFSPFEFDITDFATKGKNELRIELFNDFIYMGNGYNGQPQYEGDKLYAATGLGWDDPKEGWHHCPAGMGLYDSVRIEVRNKVCITDFYIRPLNNSAEYWIEVENSEYCEKNISFSLSLYGQNFESTVFENLEFVPQTCRMVGRGDSLTEAELKDSIGTGIAMPAMHGKNIYKFVVDIENPKIWSIKNPYLYQGQVRVLYGDKIEDAAKQQFGMRTFEQDVDNSPKGMFYLNGNKIRLRGANTMGFEQQDVLRGDIEQLIDDILLAKICNMNFLRLTQRPVQNKVYEYCDKLGLMTQTDLPLFGCMRRTKICEGVRQVEEMERIVRKHPCNVIISYINEPFPNANNEPHRHLERDELEKFFTMCDIAVKIQNPERVIKHIDGDYDPPTEGMPDNHCYPMWYNGHGIDIGRLNRGYWLSVKPDWYYGCGEYGAEGLDFCEVMKDKYPKEWTKEPFSPKNIVRAQTGDFHYFFYDTQTTMEKWVEKSQEFQAFATDIMTEAFRRDGRMISNAIHLFIDAWPSGWMKTIMDCRRNPKPAYFAYKNALEPITVFLRTDRFTYYSGEMISVEAYLCNDTNDCSEYKIRFEYYVGKCFKGSNEIDITALDCQPCYVTNAEFVADDVEDREKVVIRAILLDKNGKQVTYNDMELEIFKDVDFKENEETVIISGLAAGVHEIAGETVCVKNCGMLPVHFVSRNTAHKAVSEFEERDFSYWYDKDSDMITPILNTTFTADGFTPILTSGNTDENGNWNTALACGEKIYNGKRYIICQVDLRLENPIAKRFLKNLNEL